MTAKNKAEMVLFAKQKLEKLVLAVGDGANDVPMIQAANIGVGLYGNEGMNAVQASDFALPQFKALWRLLFVHGRWNYLRIAQLIKYFFYKNMVFTLGQLWFAYLCSFTGTSIYDATYLVLYNTIFTGGPVLVRALLEQDLNYVQIIQQIKHENEQMKPSGTAKKLNEQLLQDQDTEINQKWKYSINSKGNHVKVVTKLAIDQNLKKLFPLLYAHSQEQQALTPCLFGFLIFQSMVESFCIFLIIYFGIQPSQLSIYSICLYSTVLALVTIRICYDIQYWTWLMVAVLLFTSIFPYLAFIYLMSIFQLVLAGTFVQMFQIPDFYLCLGLALGVGLSLQGTFGLVGKYYFPTPADSVRKEWKNLQKQQEKELKTQKDKRKEVHRKTVQAKYQELLQSNRSLESSRVQIELKQIKGNKKMIMNCLTIYSHSK